MFPLNIRAAHREIWVVIYTFFKLYGSKFFRKEVLLELDSIFQELIHSEI